MIPCTEQPNTTVQNNGACWWRSSLSWFSTYLNITFETSKFLEFNLICKKVSIVPTRSQIRPEALQHTGSSTDHSNFYRTSATSCLLYPDWRVSSYRWATPTGVLQPWYVRPYSNPKLCGGISSKSEHAMMSRLRDYKTLFWCTLGEGIILST